MKAHKHLINYAIQKGLVISVNDGEEWQVKRSQNKKDILSVIDSVGESQIIIRDQAGNKIAWALIIDYPDEPENTIVDCSDNEFMSEWEKSYQKTL